MQRATTWIRDKAAPKDQARMAKFETLRVLATMLIVFFAVLVAGWLTALWVSGIVGASMAYGVVLRAKQTATRTQSQV